MNTNEANDETQHATAPVDSPHRVGPAGLDQPDAIVTTVPLGRSDGPDGVRDAVPVSLPVAQAPPVPGDDQRALAIARHMLATARALEGVARSLDRRVIGDALESKLVDGLPAYTLSAAKESLPGLAERLKDMAMVLAPDLFLPPLPAPTPKPAPAPAAKAKQGKPAPVDALRDMLVKLGFAIPVRLDIEGPDWFEAMEWAKTATIRNAENRDWPPLPPVLASVLGVRQNLSSIH